MKKFLTVLLVIAVMFTFSFGSAFATTGHTETSEDDYMQISDYLHAFHAGDDVNGYVPYNGTTLEDATPAKAVGAVGVTEAEIAKYVSKLEDIAYYLDEDETYGKDGEAFSGAHLTAVKGYVADAITAVKAAKTSKAIKEAMKALKVKVDNEDTDAELTAALKAEFKSASGIGTWATGDTVQIKFNKVGTYVVPGYAYYVLDTVKTVDVITYADAETYYTADAKYLEWCFDNGFDTLAQVSAATTTAKYVEGALFLEAGEQALTTQKDSANDTFVGVYGLDKATNSIQSAGLDIYYEMVNLAKRVENCDNTNTEAMYALYKDCKAFDAKYNLGNSGYTNYVSDLTTGKAKKVYDAINKTNGDVKNQWDLAVKYYDNKNFVPTWKTLKDYTTAKQVLANKADIVAFAKTLKEFADKYDVDLVNSESAYKPYEYLATQLRYILDGGVKTLSDAFAELSTVYPEDITKDDADALTAFKAALASFETEFVESKVFAKWGPATTSTFATYKSTPINKLADICEVAEAYVKAADTNLVTLGAAKETKNAELQSYLNNATLKVTTSALGNNKIRVQARFDADTYKEIVGKLDKGYTISYKFYHKTAKANTYKAAKEKDRNYITYTKKSLKKGTKYKFQCAVIVKDAKGNVVATKDYKASTVGSRICR